MAPRKRRSRKAALKEEEKPKIALDFSGEQESETNQVENPEASVNAIVEAIRKFERKRSEPIELSEIEEISPANREILREHEIDSVQTLIAADVSSLSDETQFSAEVILEWQEKGKGLLENGEKKERKEKVEEVEKIKKSGKQRETKSHMGKKLRQNIQKLKHEDGVIGYILRDAKSASIDLKDPTRVIDFAILSSSAFEASEKLSSIFALGNIRHIAVEGGSAKFLSLTVGENIISVFVEKNVDLKDLYKDLLD